MQAEMPESSKALQRLVWSGLALVVLAILAGYLRQANARSHAGSGPAPPLPVLGQVTDFALTNQDGQRVTLADLRGQVWVADVIFTICAGPCPRLTASFGSLQADLPTNQPVRLVTISTDPTFDTPAVLKRYGQRFHADFNRWTFLTGDKPGIVHLIQDGLKLIAKEKDATEQENASDRFIHSTLFVVVDQTGRLRAAFDGDEPASRAQILKAIDRLLKEE
ncbi:MAG TPA: SCO family protein [Verrucomicrobiae bacterium]|nr:SCO family protein [Verrucomicrobiae bacterium]